MFYFIAKKIRRKYVLFTNEINYAKQQQKVKKEMNVDKIMQYFFRVIYSFFF